MSDEKTREKKRPNLAQYSRDTVLDPEQCAEWLGTSVDTLERSDIPTPVLGANTRRYIVGQVLDHLTKRLRLSA